MRDIQKFSEKWQKEYKGFDNPWPKDGTFDVGVCGDMECHIKDRKKEKELELKIIKLFKKEGDYFRKNNQIIAEL